MKAELVVELYSQIELISNSSIRVFVQDMVSLGRSSFFTRPASRNHHLPDERGESGNLLHSIRVIKIVLILADACGSTKDVRDILVAAATLHDLRRYGSKDEFDHSCENHPLLVRMMAKEHGLSCDYFELIMRIIENHMGRWGNPPYIPQLGLDDILHFADCVSARALEVI